MFTGIGMAKNSYFDTVVRILEEQFCRLYDSSHNLNKHTTLKFSRLNIENSRTTITYNTGAIFSDYQHME